MEVNPVGQGQIDSILKRLSNLYADLSTTNDQMEKRMTFLSGSWPVEVGSEECGPVQEDSLIARVNDGLRAFEKEVRRTKEISDRLNEL